MISLLVSDIKKMEKSSPSIYRDVHGLAHALIVQRSKTAYRFFSLLYLNFHLFSKCETIVKSRAWSFGHSDPDPSSVITYLTKALAPLCFPFSFGPLSLSPAQLHPRLFRSLFCFSVLKYSKCESWVKPIWNKNH